MLYQIPNNVQTTKPQKQNNSNISDNWSTDSSCKIVKTKKQKRNKIYNKIKYDNGTITKLIKGQNIVYLHYKTNLNLHKNYDIIGYRSNELKNPEKIIINLKTSNPLLFIIEFYTVKLNDGDIINIYNIKKECLCYLAQYTKYLTLKGFAIKSYYTKNYGKKMYIQSYVDNYRYIQFHGYSVEEQFELTFTKTDDISTINEKYAVNGVHIYYKQKNINGCVIVPLFE